MTETPKLAFSDPDLLQFARCCNDYVSMITDRWDLVVRAGRGLGRGAPACFIPSTAEVEIDAAICCEADKDRLDKIGWRISSIDIVRPKHRALVPVTTGALAHEGGHSLYSLWPWNEALRERMATEPKQVVDLAMALEEGRQESRLIRRDKSVKEPIARMLYSLILPGFKHVNPEDAYGLLRAFCLLYPREQAGHVSTGLGSLYKPIEKLIGSVSAWELWASLDGRSASFSDFFKAAADNGPVTLDLARYLWERLPEDAKDKTPNGAEGPSCPGHGEEGEDSESSGPDALADIKEAAKTMAGHLDGKEDDKAVKAAKETEKSVGGKEATERGKTTKKPGAYHSHSDEMGGSGVDGSRAPTTKELAVARRVGAALRSAQVIAKTKTPMAVPPGSLRGRSAISWSRDRAMGKATDVKLFKGKGKDSTVPPVRLGIAMDVSGSMGFACELAASLGWTVAAAAWDAEALVAGVCFGGALYPYIEVGKSSSTVKTIKAHDGTELIYSACDYLDSALDLMNGEGPRILVIISDCGFVDDSERRKGAKWVRDFVKSGGNVIYVGRRDEIAKHYSTGYPLPPAKNVHDVKLDLDSLASEITTAIRKAYARL